MSLPSPGSYLPSPGSPSIKPGWGWFVVGVVVLVLGPALGAGLIVRSVISFFPDFIAEIPAGSRQTVQLDQAGEWGLFGASTDDFSPRGMQGCIIEGVDGTPATKASKTFDFNFTRGGHQWYWIDSFTVSAPGEYVVDCGKGGNVDRYAVGDRPHGSDFVGGLLSGIAAIILGFLVGLVIIIVTAVRRSSSKGRLRESATGQSYPPYQPL